MVLYVCTLYEEIPTLQMYFTLNILKLNGIVVEYKWLKAGKFQKGGRKDHKEDKSEVRWRQRLIDSVPIGYWFLVMDSDEIPFGSLDILESMLIDVRKKGGIVCNIIEIRENMSGTLYPRLIFKCPEMEYGLKHYTLKFDNQNLLGKEYPQVNFRNIGFVHYKNTEQLNIALVRN